MKSDFESVNNRHTLWIFIVRRREKNGIMEKTYERSSYFIKVKCKRAKYERQNVESLFLATRSTTAQVVVEALMS